jgi:hypothetical protein
MLVHLGIIGDARDGIGQEAEYLMAIDCSGYLQSCHAQLKMNACRHMTEDKLREDMFYMRKIRQQRSLLNTPALPNTLQSTLRLFTHTQARV